MASPGGFRKVILMVPPLGFRLVSGWGLVIVKDSPMAIPGGFLKVIHLVFRLDFRWETPTA